jgi:hypothetical protein
VFGRGREREDKKKRVDYKITINILQQCVPFIREDEQVIGKRKN